MSGSIVLVRVAVASSESVGSVVVHRDGQKNRDGMTMDFRGGSSYECL